MDKTKDKEATNVNGQAQINEEEPLECPIQHGYKPSICRYLILYPLATIPCGIGLLLAYWFPYVWIKLTCVRVSLSSAKYVIVKDTNGKWRVEKVLVRTDNEDDGVAINDGEGDEGDYTERAGLIDTRSSSFRLIIHQHLTYLFDEVVEKFVLLRGYEKDVSCVTLHNMANGLSFSEHNSKRLRYGSNDIDVPVKPYHVLFIEEVLHPFYIFQLFSCLVWLADAYYVYAVAVWIISTVSVVVSLVQTRRHMQHLHNMVKTKTDVSVIRNGTILSGISSEDLVPGDVLVVPRDGMTMPCDSVLLTGNAIVNEAMLTGESVPITKTPLPSEDIEYSSVAHRRHTLFAGTEVIQSRYYNNAPVLAVVVRTGFLTSKGGMVRSILFPKPLNMKFYWDSIKFILILSVLAAIAFVYTILVLQIRTHPYQIKETILRAFDIITTVVPPSLPAAITVGTVYALNRLKKHQIYCISPQRVILCGKVKLVCFDKTGTLTEDSLDVLGVQPATSRGFSTLVSDPSELCPGPLLYGMSTCHSLTRINGKLSGDPLDMKMFLSTKWELEEPGSDDVRYDTLQMPLVHPPKEGAAPTDIGRCSSPWEHQKGLGLEDEGDDEEGGMDSLQLGILKQFTFSSELQRMSVLVRKLPSKKPNLIHVFVKGAPEMIKRLSNPASIPEDFNAVLGSLTQRGYRVLAMGYREIHKTWHHAERLKRDEIERDLTFCGFLILENKLKTQTVPVIHELQQANIRTVMITGDNLLTAVAVAGNCGMVHTHERIIVMKANKPSVNNQGLPTLTYHVLGSEGVNYSLLCASSSSVIVDKHQPELNGSDPFITNGGAINGKSVHVIDIETSERFHLAVDGASFSLIKEHYPELYNRLLVCGTVFARMSPNQKATLVTSLMEIGYGVTMCGDGANDCGALKAAHAGISLSETEASVASPFTSKTPDISCVPHLIREGRDALVTSISVFKFMALYSLTEFTSAAVLYAFESNLGSPQYLYVDMILILAFAFVMGLTGPYPRLVKRRPIGTLAGVHVILSILTQTFIMVAFQLGVLYYAQSEPWFEPLHPVKESDNISCYENAVIFVYSNYIYIILAVAFSTAAPYRKPFYTNVMFVLVLVLLIPCNLYMTLVPGDIFPWFWSFMQIKQSPSLWYRIALVEIAAVHFVLAYLLEGFVFPSGCMRVFLRFVRCKRKPRNRYKHLLQEVKEDSSWPPPMPTVTPAVHY